MSVYRYGKLTEYYNAVLESELPVFSSTWETLLEKGTLVSQHLFVVNLLFPDLIKRNEETRARVYLRRDTDYYMNYYYSSGNIWTCTNRYIPTIPEMIMEFSTKREKWLNYVNRRYK